jgi:hypothetical protein
MNKVLNLLKTQSHIRQAQRDNEADVQRLVGVCTDIKGRVQGKSLNSNGNRAYIGLGGPVDADGNTTYSRVVNAWIENPVGTFQPGTAVTLRFARDERRYYITGLNAVSVAAAGASVQFNNPYSANQVFIDPGFLKPFLARPQYTLSTTTSIEVKPGILYTGTKRLEFVGEVVDFSGYVTSTDKKKIVQFWFDPDTEIIQATTSNEINVEAAWSSVEWTQTLLGATGWLPLEAYKADEYSDVSVTAANLIVDNRPLYTLPGGSAGGSNVISKSNTIPSGKDAFFAGGLTITGGLTVSGELYILP